MPVLQVNLMSGYSADLKNRMLRSLTAVVGGITRASPDAISVWIHEVSPESYSRGGVSRQPGAGAADPAGLVSEYLDAMEKRELDKAQRYLANDFVVTLPGSVELTSLSRVVEWAGGRYRSVNKTLTSVSVAYEMERTSVFVYGTLSGQWLDGTAFEGIRFIDRFELKDDQILKQDVWNDLANTQLRTD